MCYSLCVKCPTFSSECFHLFSKSLLFAGRQKPKTILEGQHEKYALFLSPDPAMACSPTDKFWMFRLWFNKCFNLSLSIESLGTGIEEATPRPSSEDGPFLFQARGTDRPLQSAVWEWWRLEGRPLQGLGPLSGCFWWRLWRVAITVMILDWRPGKCGSGCFKPDH